jgi:hypothetical protein
MDYTSVCRPDLATIPAAWAFYHIDSRLTSIAGQMAVGLSDCWAFLPLGLLNNNLVNKFPVTLTRGML